MKCLHHEHSFRWDHKSNQTLSTARDNCNRMLPHNHIHAYLCGSVCVKYTIDMVSSVSDAFILIFYLINAVS